MSANRIRRLAARTTLIAGLIPALLLAVGTGTAHAAGSTGRYTAANCGWYVQDAGPTALQDYKIVRANLPAVTGTSYTSQYVWLYIQFKHDTASGWSTYRSGWFYTQARYGYWSTSWTSNATGARMTYVDDAPGESGYVGGDSYNPQTAVLVSLYWQTGSTTTGSAAEWEQNNRNVNNSYICNGGANLF